MLDPRQRSQPDIARLYARSFDSELAFLTLKRELGLHTWWSSKRILMWQQILVVLVVAQLIEALRIEIAVQAGVDAFDVSLPLLVEYLPRLLARRQDPVGWVLTYGSTSASLAPPLDSRSVPPRLLWSRCAFRHLISSLLGLPATWSTSRDRDGPPITNRKRLPPPSRLPPGGLAK